MIEGIKHSVIYLYTPHWRDSKTIENYEMQLTSPSEKSSLFIVEDSMTHLENIVGVLRSNKVAVMLKMTVYDNKLWNCWIHCHTATFDWQIYNICLY